MGASTYSEAVPLHGFQEKTFQPSLQHWHCIHLLRSVSVKENGGTTVEDKCDARICPCMFRQNCSNLSQNVGTSWYVPASPSEDSELSELHIISYNN